MNLRVWVVLALLCLSVLNVDAKRRTNKHQDNEPEASLSNFIFKIMNVESLTLPPQDAGPRLSNYGRRNYRNSLRYQDYSYIGLRWALWLWTASTVILLMSITSSIGDLRINATITQYYYSIYNLYLIKIKSHVNNHMYSVSNNAMYFNKQTIFKTNMLLNVITFVLDLLASDIGDYVFSSVDQFVKLRFLELQFTEHMLKNMKHFK